MKAVRIHQPGDHHSLVLEDAPTPVPATGDVLVRVHAASFVPDELHWPGSWVDRAGRDRTPTVPAHEVAGVVAEVRYGSTGFSVGERVYGLGDWHRDGAAAEFIAIEARSLAALPDAVDFSTAAALPLAGLTAWQGLFTHGGLAAGQRVLVHGAAGGTGSLAVQLAHRAGAQVIASGRGKAAALAKELGAEQFVDLEQDPLAATAGQVDLVFDTIGGELLAASAQLVRPGGVLVSVTAPPPVAPEAGRSAFFIVEPDRGQLAELARQTAAGLLKPQVGAVFPLAQAREAFAAKQHGIPGKAVLRVL